MSNLNESESNFGHLIIDKLLKHLPNFVKNIISYSSYQLLNIDRKMSLLSIWRYK